MGLDFRGAAGVLSLRSQQLEITPDRAANPSKRPSDYDRRTQAVYQNGSRATERVRPSNALSCSGRGHLNLKDDVVYQGVFFRAIYFSFFLKIYIYLFFHQAHFIPLNIPGGIQLERVLVLKEKFPFHSRVVRSHFSQRVPPSVVFPMSRWWWWWCRGAIRPLPGPLT